jgi:colanic acid/amylovoran biosynthesis glycosyltransferase
MASSVALRLAYLVSQYPTANHTYILREIRALRSLGFKVHVISIRASDRLPEELTQEELDEQRQTRCVLTAGVGAILAAHGLTLLQRPLAYLAGLWETIRLANGNIRNVISNFIYFGEAVVIGQWVQRMSLTHIHCHFSSTVALFVARIFPITFSATMHGPDEFNDVIGFHIAEKVARARFLCAISSYARSQLMKASDSLYWDKLEVSPLGIDCSAFQPRDYRQNSERFEILCVGRLAPAKAQQVLVGAIDRLIREGRRSIHLRLVGDGPNRARLESAISGRILQS